MLSSRALTFQHEQLHRELGESRQLEQDQEESCQLRKEHKPIYPAHLNWKKKFDIFIIFNNYWFKRSHSEQEPFTEGNNWL